jgi:hypothetical protein
MLEIHDKGYCPYCKFYSVCSRSLDELYACMTMDELENGAYVELKYTKIGE